MTEIGKTALMWAVVYGKTDVIEMLLAAGADIAVDGKDGTALQIATKRGYTECTKLLEDAAKDIRPTCEEVGILPPEKRGRPQNNIAPTSEIKTGVAPAEPAKS